MYRLASSNVTREHGHAALACGRAADLLDGLGSVRGIDHLPSTLIGTYTTDRPCGSVARIAWGIVSG